MDTYAIYRCIDAYAYMYVHVHNFPFCLLSSACMWVCHRACMQEYMHAILHTCTSIMSVYSKNSHPKLMTKKLVCDYTVRIRILNTYKIISRKHTDEQVQNASGLSSWPQAWECISMVCFWWHFQEKLQWSWKNESRCLSIHTQTRMPAHTRICLGTRTCA